MADIDAGLLKLNLEDRFMDEFLYRVSRVAEVIECTDFKAILNFKNLLMELTITNHIFKNDSTSFKIDMKSDRDIKYLNGDTKDTYMTKDRVVFYIKYLLELR